MPHTSPVDTLYFSGSSAEGDNIKSCAGESGDMPGLITTFTAGFVSELAGSDLSKTSAMDMHVHKGILMGCNVRAGCAGTGFEATPMANQTWNGST